MLRCSDGTLYTGWTYDLTKRLEAHNSGKGAKYTRSRLPVEMVYVEVYSAKEAAMSREFAIKRMTRKQKFQLIASGKYGQMVQTQTMTETADERKEEMR